MLPVSLSFAAALALFSLFLAYRIVKLRLGHRVLINSGENLLLETRMRAHANFVEYAPFVFALVLVIELAGGSRTGLWAAVILFLLARILHAFGIDTRKPNALRAAGALGTWAILLALAIWALVIASHGPAAPHETFF